MSAGRTFGFRDELDRLETLRVEVGLLGDFRIVAENGASAAFEETPLVQAFYDQKGRSAFLEAWVLALGITPYSAAAYCWEDAPPVGLTQVSVVQNLLRHFFRPFGANFRTFYQRTWDDDAKAWRQTGRHRLWLLPGVEVIIVTEALIDVHYGCREITVSNGGRRSTFKLAELGVVGDVGIPRHLVSLESA
jgi:hypothetical protein